MIALLAATAALAAPVSLTAEWPVGWTRSVGLQQEASTTWGPVGTPVRPTEFGSYGGLLLDVALEEPHASGEFTFLSIGVRTWSAGWDVEPSFSASVTEVVTDVGFRQEIGEGRIVPFGTMGGGLQVTTAVIERWSTHVNPMIHAFSGLGARTDGRVRLIAQLKVGLGVRLDHYEGRIEAPGGALVWRYFPGSASLSFVAGLEFS